MAKISYTDNYRLTQYSETLNLPENLAHDTADNAIIDAALKLHNDSISAINGSILSINGSIGTINGSIASMAGELADHESRISTNEANIARLEPENIEALENKVATNALDIERLQNDINRIDTDLDSIHSDISTINSDLGEIHTKDSAQDLSIADHASRLSILESCCSTVQGSILAINGAIADLDRRVTNLESEDIIKTSQIRLLASTLNTAGADIADLDRRVTALEEENP